MREVSLGALLLLFAPLSLLSVGGGQSVLAEIQSIVVGNGWMTQTEFLNTYAIARVAPGPTSLIVTLIGWKVAGWQGAIVASIAIFVPSSLLLYSVINVWARFRGAAWQIAVERGLGPVASGLILASSAALLQHAEGGWIAWMLAASSCVAALITSWSPILMLFAGAGVFVGLTTLLGG
jgi:chromate transporter